MTLELLQQVGRVREKVGVEDDGEFAAWWRGLDVGREVAAGEHRYMGDRGVGEELPEGFSAC